jgi:hypothetical protein
MKLMNFKKSVAAMALALVLLIGIMPMGALAAEDDNNTVSIQVALNLAEDSKDTPAASLTPTFKFTLAPAEGSEDAPMPENDTVELTFKAVTKEGEENPNVVMFDPITFTEDGRYDYKVTMSDADGDIPSGFTHDATVYDIAVRADTDENGEFYVVYMVTKETKATTEGGDDTEKDDDTATIPETTNKEVVKADAIAFVTSYTYTPPSSNTSTPTNPSNPDSDSTISPSPDPSDEPNASEEETNPGDDDNPDGTDPNNPDNPNGTNPNDPNGTGTTEGNPDGTGTNTNGTSPKTGDDTDNIPWIILLCAVIVGMICCVRYIRAGKSRGKR